MKNVDEFNRWKRLVREYPVLLNIPVYSALKRRALQFLFCFFYKKHSDTVIE